MILVLGDVFILTGPRRGHFGGLHAVGCGYFDWCSPNGGVLLCKLGSLWGLVDVAVYD